MISQKVDEKGLRTHCPHCNIRLQRRHDWKSETCQKCRNKVSYYPMHDLPYTDTNVPVYQSKEEIEKYLEQMGLTKIGWTKEFHENNARSNILQAVFDDGTGFRFELPAIIQTGDEGLERQTMRIIFHYIKAISITHQMGILSKAEMMLGLLRVGETNLGKSVSNESMLRVMSKASELLGSGGE